MNIVDLFAKGGLTKFQEAKGEQLAAQLLTDLQSLVGIEPEQAVQVLNQFKDDSETLAQIQSYVENAKNPNSDETIRSNAISELTKIFNPNMEESQIFKCGGKLQQLTAKFGKGGGVDCGCGGIKLGEKGTIIGPKLADVFAEIKAKSSPIVGIGRRKFGFSNDRFGEQHFYEFGDINNVSTQTRINVPQPGDTLVYQQVGRNEWNKTPIEPGSTAYESIMERNRPDINRVTVKQEGGELTRKRARELASANKGFNNSQFNLAFANAKNALRQSGLRGRDLRTRALAMASGYSDQLPVIEPAANLQHNNIDFRYVDGLVGNRPTKEQLATPVFNVEQPVITAPKRKKQGVITVGPLTDGYQDFAAARSAEAAKEAQNYAGYAEARDRERLATGLFETTDGTYGVSGNPTVRLIERRNRNHTQPSNESLNPNFNKGYRVPLVPFEYSQITLKQGGEIK